MTTVWLSTPAFSLFVSECPLISPATTVSHPSPLSVGHWQPVHPSPHTHHFPIINLLRLVLPLCVGGMIYHPLSKLSVSFLLFSLVFSNMPCVLLKIIPAKLSTEGTERIMREAGERLCEKRHNTITDSMLVFWATGYWLEICLRGSLTAHHISLSAHQV